MFSRKQLLTVINGVWPFRGASPSVLVLWKKKEVTFFTTVKNSCREWNSLFLIPGQLCDRRLKPQMGNESSGNGEKSLLLLNGSGSATPWRCVSHWAGCLHSQRHSRGNATDPLGTHLRVSRTFIWLRLVRREVLRTDVCPKWAALSAQQEQRTCERGRLRVAQGDSFTSNTSARWGDSPCGTKRRLRLAQSSRMEFLQKRITWEC